MTNDERRELRKLAQEMDLIFERADADDPTLYGFGYCGFAPDNPEDAVEHRMFLFISNNVDELRRWALRQAPPVDQYNVALKPPG
jgi:hypothetical protein